MKVIDLSIPVTEDLPVPAEPTGYEDPPVKFEPWVQIEHKGFRITKITMGPHAGTHCDVPSHFVKGGKSVNDYSAQTWIGWTVIMDFRNKGPITKEKIIPYRGRILNQPDAIPVLINNTSDPFTDEARELFISWKPKIVIMGQGTNVDEEKYLADSNAFLQAGIPMVMNANYEKVMDLCDNDLLIAAPVNFVGLEAAPIRLIAISELSGSLPVDETKALANNSSYEEQIVELQRKIGQLVIELEIAKRSK